MSKIINIINNIDNNIGLYKNDYSIKQEDTSQFDVDDDDNNNNSNKNKNVMLRDAEIKVLRRQAVKIKCEKVDEKKVMFVVNDNNINKRNNVSSKEIDIDNQLKHCYLLDWDKEISQVMVNTFENDDDDESESENIIITDKNSKNKVDVASSDMIFIPRATLKLNMSSIAGLDEENFNSSKVIDAIDESAFLNSSIGDPLDVLIPNPKQYTDKEDTYNEIFNPPTDTSSQKKREKDREKEEKLSQFEKFQKMQELKLERIKNVSMKGINYDSLTSTRALSNKLENLRAKIKLVLANIKHHTLANTNKNTKMDLTSIEVRYFHRPRLPESLKKKKWFIDINKSIHIKKTTQNNPNPNPNARPIYSDAEKLDLSIINGNFICVEFMEEIPPLIQNYGMGSSIFNYYRSYQKDDDNKLKKDEPTLLVNTDTRLPKHLQLLLEHRSTRSSNNFDINAPRLDIGETKILAPDETSPFLAPIAEGEQIQAMVNTLYRAPIFDHKKNKSDFILVKIRSYTSTGGIDKSIMTYALREIPRIFVLGQVEPQRVVPKPKPKTIHEIQEKMFKLAAARYLQINDQGAEFGDIQRYILKHSMQKSNYRDSNLKKLLRSVAEEVDLQSGKKWFPKEVGDDDFDRVTPEDLEKQFSPEDVAVIESCNSAELRLQELGIVDIDLSRIAQYCSRLLKWKFFKEGRLDALKKIMRQETPGPRKDNIEVLINHLVADVKRLKKKMDVAQFIFDRLVIAPWNTTEAYVKSQLEPDGNGKMEITGQGDPSGRGEAFAFVRLIKDSTKLDRKEMGPKNKLTKLEDADAIRKLVELSGLPRPVVSAMKRWERIDMIREYSTRAVLAGKTGYEEFARTSTNSALVHTQNLYKEMLRKVWELQKEALKFSIIPSLPDIDENNNEAIGTLDDAKSDEDDEDEIDRILASRAVTNANSSDLSSNNDSTQRRAAIEQEENELRELKDSSFFNSLHRQSNTTRVRISTDDHAAVPNPVCSYPEGWIRPQKVVKRVRRVIDDTGEETLYIEYIIDDSEVDRVSGEKETRVKRKKLRSTTVQENYDIYEEENEKSVKVTNNKLTFKVKIGGGKDQLQQKGSQFNELDQYVKPKPSSGRGNLNAKYYRLPHIALAVKLEKELMAVWNAGKGKKFYAFRYPVSETYPGYYEKIERPMSLSDIREKLGERKYLTLQSFMDDVNLIAQNCELFNGPNSELTKSAHQLVSQLVTNLTHDARSKDQIKQLEDSIKKKFVYLKRS